MKVSGRVVTKIPCPKTLNWMKLQTEKRGFFLMVIFEWQSWTKKENWKDDENIHGLLSLAC